MIQITLFILEVCILTYFFLYRIRVYVHQYYSFRRMVLSLMQQYKKKSLVLFCLFFAMSILIYFYCSQSIGIFFSLCSLLLFYQPLQIRIRYTRRSIMLSILSFIILVCVELFIYYQVDALLSVYFLFILIDGVILISSLVLFPLEALIRHYYLSKARKKIKRNHYTIIGVTGSYGKTTMKNMLYSILRTKYLISNQNHNYNTVMGLCKYINNEVLEQDDILLVELGVDHPRSMKKFKKLFHLDYAFITAIGKMHLATFHSLENIMKEKCAIEGLLNADGKLYVSDEIDKNYLRFLKKNPIIYSTKQIEVKEKMFYEIKYKNKWIQTPIVSRYQLNALVGAILCGENLGLSSIDIFLGLRHIQIPSRRLNIKISENQMVIDDSYNANLDGFKEDIRLLTKGKGIKILVTGGLVELGKDYSSANRIIGKCASDIEVVILISKEENHPFVQGYVQNNQSKFYQVSSLKEAWKIIDEIKQTKTILFTSKGFEEEIH